LFQRQAAKKGKNITSMNERVLKNFYTENSADI